MSPKAIVIDLGKNSTLIGVCGVNIKVNVKQWGQFLARRLHISQKSIIFPYSEVMILFVRVSLLNNRDFLFHPTSLANLTFYSHIVDHKTLKVLVKNVSDQPLCVSRQHKLDHLLDIAYNNCFPMDTQSAYKLAAVLSSSHSFSNVSVGPILLSADYLMETIFNNQIRVYGNTNIVKQISDLVTE